MHKTGEVTMQLRIAALGLVFSACGTIGPSVEDVATASAAQTEIAVAATMSESTTETSADTMTPTLETTPVPTSTPTPAITVTPEPTVTEESSFLDEDPIREDLLDLCVDLNSWLEGYSRYVDDAESWDYDSHTNAENIHKTRERFEHIISLRRGFFEILWPPTSREVRDLILNYTETLLVATNGYLDYLYDELTYDEFLDKVQERDDAYTVAFDAWEDLAAEHDFDPYDCDGLRIPKPTPFPTWTPLPVSAAVPTSSPTPSAPSFSGEVFVYLYNNLDHSVKLALWGVIEREVNVEAGEVLTTLVPSGSYSFKVFGIEGCETLAETETIPDNHYLAIYFDPDPTAPNPPCLWEWDFAVARE